MKRSSKIREDPRLREVAMSTEPLEVVHNETPPPEPTAVLALLATLAAWYVAKRPLVVLLVSILIAFILAPLVDLLERVRLPRAVSAAIVVALVLGMIGGAGVYGWNAATDFARDMPKYSG